MKLSLRLQEDSGNSASDNYTNNPNIILSGVPQGARYEYSVDGGLTWQQAINENGGEVTFRLPDNGKTGGQTHRILARIANKVGEYDADPITMTYDHIVDFRGSIGGDGASSFMGIGEIGAKVELKDQFGQIYGTFVVGDASRRAVLSDEIFLFDLDLAPKNSQARTTWSQGYFLTATDKAGNTQVSTFTQHTAYTISNATQAAEMNALMNNGADSIYVKEDYFRYRGTSGKSSISNTGSEGLQTYGGDDSIIVQNTVENARIDMGAGHDFFYASNTYATAAAPVVISMGEGDDIVSFGVAHFNNFNPSYLFPGSEVNLGSGNDKLIIVGGPTAFTDTKLDHSGQGQLIGGSGFDSLVMTGGLSTLGEYMQIGKWNGIREFEKLEMREAFFANDLSIGVLRNNHSATLIDDNGQAHQGVFVIDGDNRSKVSFDHSEVRAVQKANVTFEGKTYQTYHYDSGSEHYELWLQSGIVIV